VGFGEMSSVQLQELVEAQTKKACLKDSKVMTMNGPDCWEVVLKNLERGWSREMHALHCEIGLMGTMDCGIEIDLVKEFV
jgi:hypothetical protein